MATEYFVVVDQSGYETVAPRGSLITNIPPFALDALRWVGLLVPLDGADVTPGV
jgi:hypothetical protein